MPLVIPRHTFLVFLFAFHSAKKAAVQTVIFQSLFGTVRNTQLQKVAD